ncbi:MAG: hypothetical protein A2W90_16655 [Bacteroidetes bacterium GWF2_42_66]|nr:MAG: hypothetical protein A2W92_03960 [Bacteroidetes bacterium GWA2_42_15]OFX96324.1 MAG: hypothetical protein A2W89_05585 [Bacteroidetes bacterium GWE2_42_39]OFY46363.1 MAG: hypothetical protein A2W90_16655 [Bacteroidetes bacterium GWF2_42_66]HAZ03486.1 hypothetical protein [Marinilabiliales bacterium]HBL78250.1 hypothetical protein [Prolixibacteraceae bacterium]
MKNPQSLNKRYAAKLSTNLVGLVIGLITTAIIPRGLGPKVYGDFSFLTNFFSQLIPFFTFNTSIGFYTKLSQRQEEFGLIKFFGRISLFAFVFLFLFILLTQLVDFSNYLWPEQELKFLFMAAFFTVLTSLADTLAQISDARGITISTEIAKIIQKSVGLLLILALYITKQLNLINFFYYNYIILLILITTFVVIINRSGFSLFQNWHLGIDQVKKYFREFYIYSRPLFVYGLVGVFVGLFDRWLLQKYGGSVQQGFFGLALKVGVLCFIFTGAMTSLITREFSIAYNRKDLQEMSRLFRRYIPLIYSIAAFISCFIAINAKEITFIVGGSQFSNAVLPMTIMAFYPIHQTYGQLSGSVFYASGQTKLYSNIGFILKILGLPLVYFAVAPSAFFGLNAGATGLAVVYVVLQFIGVNVQLFFNSKFLKLNFLKYFAHQLICVGVFVILAFSTKLFIDELNIVSSNGIITFFLSGILYSFLAITFIFIFPEIVGLQRVDIKKGLVYTKSFIKNKL